MLALYYGNADYQEDDPSLIQKCADIIRSAAVPLEKYNLVKYERASGSTKLGPIASHYYVTHSSMVTRWLQQNLRYSVSWIEFILYICALERA